MTSDVTKRKVLMHKMKRKLSTGAEFYLCTLKRADFAENLIYRWSGVTCPKCLKLKAKHVEDVKKKR